AGNLETANLLGQLSVGDTAGALETLSRLYCAGKDIKTLLGELSALVRDLLVRKTAPRGGSSLLTGGYDEATVRKLCDALTAPRLVHILSILQETLQNLPRSANSRTDAELALIRLADETLDGDVLGLSARVSRLETMMEFPPARLPSAPAAVPVPAAPQAAAPVAVPVPVLPQAAAPVAEAESPPWDDDVPLPDAPPAFSSPEPPAPEPPAPDPVPVPTPVSTAGDAALWRALLPALKGKLSPAAWPFLSNPGMTSGVYAQGTLTLTMSSPVTKAMTDKPEIKAVIAAEAEARVAEPVTVNMILKESGGDKLGDLAAFGAQFGN
ncbi:MAG: DNA polymerase III subunit gamma/tau, partial [Oscillospiraceae bacterium]